MKDEKRIIVTKLEINENKLSAIHSLEIINNTITGIYFHSYIKGNLGKYNDMYYLANNQSLEENNCIENFKKFVGDCKLITYNNECDKIRNYFENNVIENININEDLFRYERKRKINIDKKSCHGGLINCTIFGRILYDHCLNNKNFTKMTGIYNKRKYYKRKEDVEENEDDDNYEEDDEENEEDNDDDYNNDKIK